MFAWNGHPRVSLKPLLRTPKSKLLAVVAELFDFNLGKLSGFRSLPALALHRERIRVAVGVQSFLV